MNSISVLVLALLAVCALSHPADESVSKSKTKSTAREVEFDVDVKVEAEKKTTTTTKKGTNTNTRTMSHPTVKCEHIYLENGKGVGIGERRDENRVCLSHCVTLGSEYRDGKCDGGLCHCEREMSHEGNPDRVPTVKCSDLVAVAVPGEGETIRSNGEVCQLHCKTLGDNFEEGKCEGGVCTCRVS